MVALLLVAVCMGLDNFAASVDIGVSGVDARTRLRVGLIFGSFETAMPIAGLLLGHSLAASLGDAAHWTGTGLLIATGGYAVVQALRESRTQTPDGQPGPTAKPLGPTAKPLGRMLVTGLALSVDNLAVGFALGAYRLGITMAAIVIGVISVVMSLLGLELGHRIGGRVGDRGELISGVVLIAVGIALAAGVI
jgi:putative Mn2+ efflux pump MntP